MGLKVWKINEGPELLFETYHGEGFTSYRAAGIHSSEKGVHKYDGYVFTVSNDDGRYFCPLVHKGYVPNDKVDELRAECVTWYKTMDEARAVVLSQLYDIRFAKLELERVKRSYAAKLEAWLCGPVD